MNPEQKKLLFNEYLGKVLVLWKMRFRSTFKYATSDITGARALKRLAFPKALGLGNAGNVLCLVFVLLLENTNWNNVTFPTMKQR